MQGFDDTMQGRMMDLKFQVECGIFRSACGEFFWFASVGGKVALSSESGTGSFV